VPVRAGLVAENGDFEVADVADPEPQPGELLVRVSACGLCGSDLKARGVFPPGSIMGHEFGGVVADLGAGTDDWDVGVQVAVLPVASCMTCSWCRAGAVAHCPSARFLGLGGGPGGFAEFTVAPAASCFPLPDEVAPRVGALVEPFAVGLHCVRAGNVGPGDNVLIVGGGTVGLTVLAWARQLGAGRLTLIEPVAERRAMADSWGATDTLGDLSEVDPNAYDVAVECVGRPGLLDRCVGAVGPMGRVVVAGVCVEPDSVSSMVALLKEVSIRFAAYYTPAEFAQVVEAFADGRINPEPLVGQMVSLGSLNGAFSALAAGTVGGKILVDPS
jgi:2-desacetyl-2-hydroxyethyl bacteriochlorophyllide A dehydrogenase